MAWLDDYRKVNPWAADYSDADIINYKAQQSGVNPAKFAESIGFTQNEPGFFSGVRQGLGGFAEGVGRTIDDVTDDKPGVLTRYGRDVQFRNPSSEASQSWEGFKENPWQGVKELAGAGVGSTLPNIAAMAVPGGQEVGLTGLAGTAARGLNLARAIGTNGATQTALAAAPIYGQVRDQQDQDGTSGRADAKARAAAAALGGGWVETKLGVNRLLAKDVGMSAEQAGRQALVNDFAQSPLKTARNTMLRSTVEEGLEEGVQQPMQQWAAYQDPTTTESLKDTGWNMFGGAIGGMAMAPMGGVKMGMVHAKIDKYRQTDLLNPDTPLSTLDDQARWNQAFIERDHGKAAGEMFYNGQQGTIDNYLDEYSGNHVDQLRRAAHDAENARIAGNSFSNDYLDYVDKYLYDQNRANQNYGYGQAPSVGKAKAATGLLMPGVAPSQVAEPQMVTDDYGNLINPAAISTEDIPHTVIPPTGNFAIGPAARVGGTLNASTTTGLAGGSGRAGSGNVSGSMGNSSDQRSQPGPGGNPVAGTPALSGATNQLVGNGTNGVGAVKPGTIKALQQAIDQTFEPGTPEHEMHAEALGEARSYSAARKSLAKISPEGLKIALRSAPAEEQKIVQTALGWDGEGNSVSAAIPSYSDIGKAVGKTRQRVQQVLAQYGINKNVLNRVNAVDQESVNISELAPSQQEDGGEQRGTGYRVTNNPNSTDDFVDDHKTAEQTREANNFARLNHGIKNGELGQPSNFQTAAEVRAEEIAQANREAHAAKEREAAKVEEAKLAQGEKLRWFDHKGMPIQEADIEDASVEVDGVADRLHLETQFNDLPETARLQLVKAYVAYMDDAMPLANFKTVIKDVLNGNQVNTAERETAEEKTVPGLVREDSSGPRNEQAVEPARIESAGRNAEDEAGTAENAGTESGRESAQTEAENTEAEPSGVELTPQTISAAWNEGIAGSPLPTFNNLDDDLRQWLLGAADEAMLQARADDVVDQLLTEPSVNAANENPDTKYNLHTQLPSGKTFSNGKEAAEWLANNASNSAFKLVARKIAPYLGDVKVSFPQSLSEVSIPEVKNLFAGSGLGAAARWGNGDIEVHIAGWKGNATTEENLLHELVHAATLGKLLAGGPAAKEFAALATKVKNALGTWQGQYPINDQKQKTVSEFFRSNKIFGDPAEFVAYVFSSPSMQDVMRLMAADGQWNKTWRAQDEINALNKNRSYQKQKAQLVPEYSAWHKFIDTIRSLFGMPKVYNKQIAEIVAQNEKVNENNRKATTVEFETLKSKVDALLDQLLQEADVAQAQTNPIVNPSMEDTASGVIHANREAVSDNSRLTESGPFAQAGKVIDDITTNPKRFFKELKLGWTTLEQIADATKSKAVKSYHNAMVAMQATSKDIVSKASLIDQKWATIKDTEKLSSVMTRSTLEQFDPTEKATPANQEQREIKAAYNQLTPEAKALYAEVRDFYASNLKARQKIMAELATKAKLQGKELASFNEMYAKVKGPYFPLVRLGNWYSQGMSQRVADLTTKKEAGTLSKAEENELARLRKDPKHYVTSAFQSEREAKRHAESLKGRFAVTNHNQSEERMGAPDLKLPGLEHMEAYINAEVQDTELRNQVKGLMNKLAFEMAPEGSHLKRMMKREGIAGFSQDMRQVFATTAISQAHYISRLEHNGKISEALVAVSKEGKGLHGSVDARGVYNELVKRTKLANTVDKTGPVANALINMSYFAHLGVSPAFWLTNMTQVPMITLPWLGARHGFASSSTAIARAYSEVAGIVKTSIIDGNWRNELDWSHKFKKGSAEDKLFSYLLKQNLLDITMEHDLGVVARLGTEGKLGELAKFVNTPVRVSEYANRAVTGLAAYRLATQKGMSHDEAVEHAAKAISHTQLNYSELNAPRNMRSVLGSKTLAKMMMQFRKYQQGMLWLVSSNIADAVKGATPEERAVARKMLLGLAVTTGSMAGTLGLPLIGSLGFMANMIAKAFGNADEPWDYEIELRNFYADLFGDDVGLLLSKGVPAALGMDMSKRVGMGDLASPLPFTRMGNNGREAVANVAAGLLGAPAGTIADVYDGISAMAGGDALKGAEKVVPLKMAKDIIKSVRYDTEGMTDKRGNVILTPDQFTPWDLALRSAGFSPTKETEYYSANQAVEGTKQAAKDVRNALLRDYSQAKLAGEDVSSIQEKIADYNERHPEKGVKIDVSSLLKAIQQRKQMSQERNAAGVRTDKTHKPFLKSAAFADGE